MALNKLNLDNREKCDTGSANLQHTVLQQLGQLGVTECCLAEFDVKTPELF